MQIQLFKVISNEGFALHESVPFEPDEIRFQLGVFPVLEKTPVELSIVNVGDKVLEIEGRGSVTVSIPCDRCLTDVPTEIPYEIRRRLDMKLADEDRVKNLDESSYLTGMDLDVDRLVCLEVLINWPFKVLCRNDCKGLCSRCGRNLNNGPCGCKEEPKDPRMAAISDIFSKCKEEV
ncbi:MAG: DUF177 domain-containing protein [Clostridiales bacterium]|nr:DUF177 domain-containing protein [Clostridiales bacterium]MCD8153469.1 DUF177 domain-containing protein [Clostridiales bacterium]